jgi:hemerythrin-like metal-binding protein
MDERQTMYARMTKATAAIDGEHAMLLDNLRCLLDRLAADRDETAFALALRRFVGLAREHFLAEEDEFRRLGYGDLDAHRAEYTGLIDTADALLLSLTTRFDHFDRWGVALYFLHWLTNHIRRQNEAITRLLSDPRAREVSAAA